jgi:transposase-like protein
MAKKLNREKQTAILRRTQEQRKSDKRKQVFRAIEELQMSGKPLTFPKIAEVAGCSVSYLYKWPEITAYIHELQKGTQQLHKLEDKEPRPHSLKTLHEVSKQRIRELEEENQKLERDNKKLQGHVVEIFELREECDRLRKRVRELTNPEVPSNVVPLQHEPANTKVTKDDLPAEVVDALREAGIKPTIRLKREIWKHDSERVLKAIEAFIQYRRKTVVEKPGACLLAMIQDGAEPNVPQQPTEPEVKKVDTPTIFRASTELEEELISSDQLRQMFGKSDE